MRPASTVALYRHLVAAEARSQLQYRTSFALDVVATFLVSFLDFAAVLIVFGNVTALGGWSFEEVALLYGASGLAFALADLAVGHLDELPRAIRDGSFDLVLVRPRGTLLQVVAADFQLRRLGKAAQALAVLAWALAAVDVDWTVGRAAMVPVMVAAGAVIFASVWVAAICIVFWAVEGRETANAFTYGASFLTQYPITVYERWLRGVLFVVPVAFVCFYPALYVLDRPDPFELPEALRFAAPLAAAGAALAAGLVWRFAVRHYRSAGG